MWKLEKLMKLLFSFKALKHWYVKFPLTLYGLVNHVNWRENMQLLQPMHPLYDKPFVVVIIVVYLDLWSPQISVPNNRFKETQ